MTVKSLALGAAVLLAISGASFAATTTTTTTQHDTSTTNSNQHSGAGIAASKAGTEAEKAVGAGDSLTQADMKSAISLSKVHDAKGTLASAKVDDRSGNIIGPVKSVVTNKAGMPEAIHVDVGGWLGVGERVVSMSAKNFTYIPDRNILLTKMSKDQVKKMKPVKESS
jgi:hypothetical protein